MCRNHSFNIGDIVKVKGSDVEMEITTLGGKKALFDDSEKYNGKVTCKWFEDGLDDYKDFDVNELELVKSSQGVSVEKIRGFFVFIFCLLLGTNNANALAHDFEVDGIYYRFISETDTAVVVTYRGFMPESYDNEYIGDVKIPEEVSYNGNVYSVTKISGSAFKDCTELTSITIPNSVTFIGPSAFSGCTGLTDVIVPNSVTVIGDYAFNGCTGLTYIIIQDAVTSIGRDILAGTGWYSNQPDGLVYINSYLLGYKGEEPTNSLIIKEGTTIIAEKAFYNCSKIANVNIPNSVINIEEYAFYGCARLTNITIPNSVTNIGRYAFWGCI